MEVAVPGVEHVDHGQVLPGRFGVDFPEHLGNAGAGNDRVLDHDIGADLPHQAAGDLARLPEPLALSRVKGPLQVQGLALGKQGLDASRPGRPPARAGH